MTVESSTRAYKRTRLHHILNSMSVVCVCACVCDVYVCVCDVCVCVITVSPLKYI